MGFAHGGVRWPLPVQEREEEEVEREQNERDEQDEGEGELQKPTYEVLEVRDLEDFEEWFQEW